MSDDKREWDDMDVFEKARANAERNKHETKDWVSRKELLDAFAYAARTCGSFELSCVFQRIIGELRK